MNVKKVKLKLKMLLFAQRFWESQLAHKTNPLKKNNKTQHKSIGKKHEKKLSHDPHHLLLRTSLTTLSAVTASG